jgi:predicted ATPase/serine/threonine protein kinase
MAAVGMPEAGSVVAGFRIEELVARGGMGVVYRATQLSLERVVALKVVAPELAGEAGARERLLREARLAASLDHPHVLPVYEVADAEGMVVLAMRWVEGRTLAQLLAGEGPLGPERATRIVAQLAEALAAAHAIGLTHRDVKPANVLITGETGREHAYLADFGLARRAAASAAVTREAGFLGTVGYAAPEQIRGDTVGPAADLYALGCVLFECLTGREPFAAEDELAVLWAHLHEPPPLPSEHDAALAAFDHVIRTAMAKTPGERVASALQFHERILAIEPSSELRERHRLIPNEDPPLVLEALPASARTNLPSPASSFVGREHELAQILGTIEQGARLLTLTGPGGSGKTRLAIKAAATLVPAYEAGVFWVGLAALRDPALVSETIAQTLGAKGGLAEYIGEQKLLLLIDNLEHVIDAAPALSLLLSFCPNLTLLCTSRELLRVQGEVEYPVPSLAEPEAVSLFCDRSQLKPTEEIAALCVRLDNLPLAVELAAARTKAITPGQILGRLSHRLDLLKGGRDADPRHQTLRATIEWSHELLDRGERDVFAKLSVFAGSFDVEAAETICEADLDALQSLIEKSLVRRDPATGRLWMLETIRQYAHERLPASASVEELHRRHAEWFLEQAQQVWERSAQPEHEALVASLALDHYNVLSAMQWAVDSGDADLALRFGESLWEFWLIRGHVSEGVRLLARALELADDPPSRPLAWSLFGLGDLRRVQGEPMLAYELHQQALHVFRDLDDREGEASALMDSGSDLVAAGDRHGAERLHRAAIDIARTAGNDRLLAYALNSYGFALAHDAGRREEAVDAITGAIELLARIGDRWGAALSTGSLATVHLYAGQLDEAAALFCEELVGGQSLQSLLPILEALHGLAAIAARRGDDKRAARLLGIAHDIAERNGIDEETVLGRSPDREATMPSLMRETYQEFSREGLTSLDEAIAYALADAAKHDAS